MKKEITINKLTRAVRVLFLAFFILAISSFGNMVLGDNLNAVAASVTATTSSAIYSDVTSVTIDVTNVTKVLVYTTFTCQSTVSESVKRALTFQLYDNATIPQTSNEIIRHLASGKTGDYGIGSLFYIFDVTAGPNERTFTLQHKVDKNKGTESSATIVAIALNTDNAGASYPSLNNDNKSITNVVTTTSETFEAVTGLTTDAIPLPTTGGFLVAASINCYKTNNNGDDVGEWGLQMQRDGGGYSSIGNSIQRTMTTVDDYGIITLFKFMSDQPSGDYNFQVVHRRVSGDDIVNTFNTSLVAVALGYVKSGAGGRYFATDETTASTVATDLTSATPALNLSSVKAEGTSVVLLSQFGTQAAAAATANFSLTASGGSITSRTMLRHLSDVDDRGAGGITGLVTGLTAGNSYNFTLNHWTTASTITTTDIILGSLQLTDTKSPGYWTGDTDSDWDKPGNWYDGIEPTSNTNVTLYDVTHNPIVGAAGEVCNNLDIKSGSLIINSSGDLTVSGTLTNTDNTKLVIQSASASATGSLIYATGTPNATVQRYVGAGAWHQVAPMTDVSTSTDFYIDESNAAWITYHTESTNGWTYIWDLGTTLNRNQGYSYWPTIANTVEFTGTLTSADQSSSLAYSGAAATQGWNLLGNPFASALDWDIPTWGSNSTGTVYVWDNTQGTSGDYLTWNGAAGGLTNGIIPMGQGFFVQATSGGSFAIPESARLHSTQSFYKSSNSDDPTQYVRIQLDGEGYRNTVFVGFPENGTDQFDYRGDATKLYSSTETPQLFAIENGKELCINANAPLTSEGKTIPMHLTQVIEGNYTLTISQLDQLPNTSVLLEDLQTGVTQDLKANPDYTFNAFQNDDPARFLLHFTKSPDGIENIQPNTNLHIYAFGQDIYVRSAGDLINQAGELTVYDLSGKIILQQHLQNGELVKVPTSLNNSFALVKVVKEGAISIQKVTIR